MKFDTTIRADYQVRNTKFCEYLLIVSPDKTIINELADFQKQLACSCAGQLELLPLRHILLATLMVKESMEETLSRWIMKSCLIQRSFQLDFSPLCVYTQGVLSLEVKESPSLQEFNSRLHVVDDFVRASDCLPLQMVTKPHLPLAIPENFNSEWMHTLPSFQSHFQIKEIAMMKRSDPWQPFERINIFGLSS